MGYSHHWRLVKKPTPAAWGPLVLDCQTLIGNLPECSHSAGGYYAAEPLTLRGPSGKGTPIVSQRRIAFNGDLSMELDHESFELKPARTKQSRQLWCKTARKPYDLVVCAVLICAWNRFGPGTIEIGGDGDWSDWKPALDWVRATLPGEAFSHPFLQEPVPDEVSDVPRFDLRAVLDGVEITFPDLIFA